MANPFLSRSFQRTLTAMRTGTKAVKQALRGVPAARKTTVAKQASAAGAHWSDGVAVGAAGARRYRLFKPPGVRRSERLPLLVMLHGCGQDAQALADVSLMNRIATRERFLVLYPEQDRLANAQRCWNWYDRRTGRAQSEADAINAAIDQICVKHPVDPARIALAGLSAGAGMATLLATRHAATVTDYRAGGRLVATLCVINGLGHAWSGGAAGRPYGDPKGPDASRMIWSFVARQFASPRTPNLAALARPVG